MKKINSMIMVMLVPLWVISGCGYSGGGTDGGNGDGNGQDANGGDNKCTPHETTMCAEGVTYWVDSCGSIEEIMEMCDCGCNAGGTECETCTDLPCQSNTDCPTGWVCDLNTNKCKQQECSSDIDCPQGFKCDLVENVCKRDTCTPNCTGKCCGSDGCGGTCPNVCVPGEICDLGTCQCKPDVQCTSNADCPQGYYCDLTVNECKEETCVPNCTGKCCGSDGCGSTCPNSCPAGYTCDLGSCLCLPYCTSDSQCGNMQCCREGSCVPAACGNMVCGYDPVCEFSCGTCPSGSTCNYTSGQCIPDQPGEFCPAGQECLVIGGEGVLGCLIPPDQIPSTNPTNCADGGCNGNYSCYCMDELCTESICVENCGTCPAGTECCELWPDGMFGCLTTGCEAVPAGPACDGSTPCQGNAGCFTDGTNNFCIDYCSAE